jgi:hypothetical protein
VPESRLSSLSTPQQEPAVPETHPAAFISYCRDDQEFALRLAQDLKAAGAAVWLDQLDIKPGSSWDNAVEDALLAAHQMLVILTPTSVRSENVRDEISYALKQGKVVIPVLYMECVIPLRLERKQHIDFRADYARGLATLLDQLHVDKPNQSVLDKAAEGDAQRRRAWQAREAERLRLEQQSQQEAAVRQAHEEAFRRDQQSEARSLQALPQSPKPSVPIASATTKPVSSAKIIWIGLVAAILVAAFVLFHKLASSEVDETPSPASEGNSLLPQQANQMYETYTNERFGFRISYPQSFKKQTPSANGDGLTVRSEDGTAVLSAFGMNSSGESVQDRYEATIRSIHGTLGYNTTGKSWFVVTSTDGATKSYTKEFVGPASINAFTITFPADQSQYDGIITAIEKSFRPGPTQLSH